MEFRLDILLLITIFKTISKKAKKDFLFRNVIPPQRLRVQRTGAGRDPEENCHPPRRHGRIQGQAGRHPGHHRRGVEPGAAARVQPGRLPALPQSHRQGRRPGRPGGARPQQDHLPDPRRDQNLGQLLAGDVDVHRDLPGTRDRHGGAEGAEAQRQDDRGHVGGDQAAHLARDPGGGTGRCRPEELCRPDVRLDRGVPGGQREAVEDLVGAAHQQAEEVPGREAVRAGLRDLLRGDPVAEPEEEEEVLEQEALCEEEAP